MATITAQSVPVAGLDAVTWTAAAPGGDETPTGRGLVLLVSNTDAAPHTLTITTPGTVEGIAIADVDRTVAADAVAIVPLGEVYRAPATGRASVAYDDATGVEVAVVQLPRG
ncbi:hypothetical protein [Streptomonospora wellingtoniae]|uniref:Uncharacterized protein n=1 Tax=Streptomonospora wellingtoniae TaxID=3075544 RepID=A0ABU2L0I4_9ACTN|nr:hypothetical protein [Streptomonospora sp. DSM 45055]MDT0305065.1 hypothetical protein [Streptomonospora sp. DSM 45055]